MAKLSSVAFSLLFSIYLVNAVNADAHMRRRCSLMQFVPTYCVLVQIGIPQSLRCSHKQSRSAHAVASG